MTTSAGAAAQMPFVRRWWTYQRERFPLAAHGPLIAAFSFCAVSYSRMLRGEPGLPPWPALATAFVICLLFFLQLRIADEFKDFEEDSRWRPYRAVPRGLVGLRALGVLFALAAAVQLGAALLLRPPLALLLLLPWTYLAAMSHEFGAREWLKARPVTYLWTHMLIMPLVDFFATGCDWLASGAAPPAGLGWFLAASFGNGIVIEFGRKLRAPSDEEEGVQTYTALWGTVRAPVCWLLMLVATAVCATMAAIPLGCAPLLAGILSLLIAAAVAAFIGFRRAAVSGSGKRFEILSGVWTLALYLGLGALPHLLRCTS
jgi:4-hydroxybenzoate polyprenyltransferase